MVSFKTSLLFLGFGAGAGLAGFLFQSPPSTDSSSSSDRSLRLLWREVVEGDAPAVDTAN